ncbi:MAG: SRPBCC family protein [Pseudomonadota bacterium]
MRIKKEVKVQAPIDQVWQLLGPNYAKAGDWASSVYASRGREGAPTIADAPVTGRVCETSVGPFTETLENYDPGSYQLSYSATGEKMPGFLRRLTNSWRLIPAGSGNTIVKMELQADIAFPFNVLMGWMMRMQFGNLLQNSIEEFKHFAETGQPHPRKRKVDSSQKAGAARAAMASLQTT